MTLDIVPSLADAKLDQRCSRLQSWIEISAGAYRHNLAFFRQQVGAGVSLAAVVKANAYGHDLAVIAGLATANSVDLLCVHSLDEALDIRRCGIESEVLILGPVSPLRYEEVLDSNLRLVLFDPVQAQSMITVARRRGTTINVDLKVETGTHRQGVDDDDLDRIIEVLRASPLTLTGVYTHFANIEDTTELSYAELQLGRFRAVLGKLRAAGFGDFQTHAACTAASLVFPPALFDFVRLGIGQYGLWPSRETRLAFALRTNAPNVGSVLRPVLTWKTRISQVKWIARDSYVGYGCSYQTTRRTRIAVLPIGYSDGYDRRLSDQGLVLVRGRQAPIRGRICMNLMMVDVTDIDGVEAGDEVVVLGCQGSAEISAELLARLAGTINYEVVTRLAPHIPRFVVP